ncbi:hypothetical protein H8711_09000 [Clostridiaceae bacterium NSJ-31]|uniref:Uncharacterized protein n=1 Tax=Ligaoa zhengdingensis TaxID=2763658 RepID=A0A926DYB6_9FIRM|nr:DUF5711 family protein [Ligaoa zhengdingensis]MBC8547066.1 hypothetical protein [Ligaoa zhengdingensis]
MAELSDIDKIRKKRRRKVLLGRILLLVALTLLGVGLYAIKDEVSTIGFTDYIQERIAGMGAGDGYPMEFAGEQVRQTARVGEHLAVLTDSNLYLYNSSGKEIRNVQHKYSNPVMRASGRRVLIYDRGGKHLRVENMLRTVAQKELDYPIYAGAISSRGEVAVATGAQRRLGEMTVYDHMLADPAKYVWKSAENYITDLEFDLDGKGIAVAVVNAREGDLISGVRRFRFDSEEEAGRQEFVGELIHSLNAARGGLTVVTDRQTAVLGASGEVLERYDYGYEALASFDHSENGDTALLFGDARENKNSAVTLLGPDGKKLWETQISSHADRLSLGKTRVCLMVDGQLQSYDYAGNALDPQPVPGEVLAATVIGRDAYLVTPDAIEKLALE